jgi:phosphatidylserine/phosphatidylglycerophosphate/cardiolipin synthase-like enzyme
MKLLVQPEDGATPVLEAIEKAERAIDMYVFRLSYPKLERALADAVARGVAVRALIAHINGSGEASLRELESRLLGMGVTVSRTDEDLLRYHGKMMIVDQDTLYVLGYNFTRRDIERSRSLGLVTNRKELVAEGRRLFDADFDRKTYTPKLDTFVVSPLNSRASLLELLESAERQLLIYDSRLTDNMMQRVLERRAIAGVDVRVIGKVEKRLRGVRVASFAGGRLHVRAIVQDDRRAFVGSQSLRRPELDRRREIGVITDDSGIVKGITKIFEADWAETPQARRRRSAKVRAVR